MTDQLNDTSAEIETLPKGVYRGQQLVVTGGNILPANLKELVDYAQMMAKGGLALPAHFRGQSGACLAIIKKAMRWEMDEWEVANSTYSVNNRLAYEAGLIAAVVKKWAPVKEKVWSPIYEGEGPSRKCTIILHHRETGEEIKYISPVIGKTLGPGVKEPPTDYVGIWPKNSPLWRFEPDQQLYYYSIRALARRFFPDILRGVYDRDEVLTMRDITPAAPVDNFLNEEIEVAQGEVLPPNKASSPQAGETTVKIEPGFFREVEDATETPITPELIAANLEKAILYQDDKAGLDRWEVENNEDILALPPDLAKRVRKALLDRSLELDEL